MLNEFGAQYRRGHEDQQPRQTVPGQRPDAGGRVAVLAGHQRGHALEVLGVLFLDDVHDAVDADRAHQPPLPVGHGQADEVVFAHQARRLLLVCIHGHGGEGRVHQRLYGLVARRGQQRAHLQRAQQAAVLIGDKERIERVAVQPRGAHGADGLACARTRAQADKFGRHDRARGVLANFVHDEHFPHSFRIAKRASALRGRRPMCAGAAETDSTPGRPPRSGDAHAQKKFLGK